MSRSTSFADVRVVFVISLGVALAAFLLLVGLGPHSLPFAPRAAFSDAVTTHWPSALFLRRSVLEDGAWPLWRPSLMSGQPFAANPLNKVWYPPQWLVFALPPLLHLNVLAWLHLLIAGAGSFVWGRANGLLPWPAALAGVGYAFAPRVIAALGAGHLDLVYAAAWVPWLLWALERTLARANRHAWPWLGAFAALCFLADLRLALYAFGLAAAYGLWRLSKRRETVRVRRVSGDLLAAGLLAAALSAFEWVPLLLYRAQLSRSDIALHDAAQHSLSAGQWLGLVIGEYNGAWETFVYAGVSVLALAAVAILLRPRRFAIWAVALLIIALYAMGDQFVLWTALNRALPGLRWFRVPPRIWMLAALILPHLAAWGAQLLATAPPDRRAARLAAVGMLGGGAACGLFTVTMMREQLSATAALGVFALPVTALVIVAALTRRLAPPTVMILFVVVVTADLLWIDRTLIEGRSEREWLDPYQALAEHLHQDGAIRMYSPSYSLPQQAAAEWDIAQFGGVDPFQLSRYVAAAEAATGVRATGYSVTIPAYPAAELADGEDRSEQAVLASANRSAEPDAALLGRWLVTHVVSAFPLDAPGLALDATLGETYVYRNTAAPRVRLAWHTPNRVTITAEDALDGPLYAIAGGRWQNAEDTVGLPGQSATAGQTWTYTYDRSEIWLSAMAAVALLLGALVARWGWARD